MPHKKLGVNRRLVEDVPARAEGRRSPPEHHRSEADVLRHDDVVGVQPLDDREVSGVSARADNDCLHTGALGVSLEVLCAVRHEQDRDAEAARGGDGLARHGAGVGVDDEGRHAAGPLGGRPRSRGDARLTASLPQGAARLERAQASDQPSETAWNSISRETNASTTSGSNCLPRCDTMISRL